MATLLTLPPTVLGLTPPGDPLLAQLRQLLRRPTAGARRPNSMDLTGLIAVLIQRPFDPTAREPIHPDDPRPWSALEAVIDLLPETDPADPVRAWPTRLEDFAHQPKAGPAWLAALLLAAGADPWQDRTAERPLGSCLETALARGDASLVLRLMSVPGAPSWAQVAQAPVASRSASSKASNGWGVCASRLSLLPIVEILLEQRVPLPEGAPHPLEHAVPPAIEAFARHGALPQNPAQGRRILNVWASRLKARQIDAATYTQWEPALLGQEPVPARATQNRKDEIQARQDLEAVVWGGGNPRFGLRGPPQRAASHWVERIAVEGLPKSYANGTWSRLSIVWMRYLQAHPRKSPYLAAWSAHEWVEPDPTGEPPAAGALSGALGFAWRPGVSINGLAVLMLWGTANDNTQEMRVNRSLLGIADPARWLSENLGHAVGFTQGVLEKAPSAALHALTKVWAQVVDNAGRAVTDPLRTTPALASALLGSLHRGFEMGAAKSLSTTAYPNGQAQLNWESPLVDVVTAVFPRDHPVRGLACPTDSAWRSVWLEVRLLEGNAAAVEKALAGTQAWPSEDLRRIERWVAHYGRLHTKSAPPPAQAQALVQVKTALSEHRLRQAWAQPQPQPSVRGPRF